MFKPIHLIRRLSINAKDFKATSEDIISLEARYSAKNYHPLPVVFSKARGTQIWDPEGRRYLDFLSAYSAVNQGHCHPELVKALTEQAQTLCLSSRAFYNDKLGIFSEYITKMFNYDRVLPMNTGAEAVETAIKLARKWGYLHKKIKPDKALIFACQNNFHGRTATPVAMSTDESAYKDYGPFVPNIGAICPKTDQIIRHGNIQDLENALKQHAHETAAFIVEPIQGEGGIVVPQNGYLKKCYELCKKHDVLLIADEVQTGLGRTGKMLCSDYDEIKPDMIILGKALSGGMYPVSAVLADDEIMLTIKAGEHGSTYGGNPLACSVAIKALEIIKKENLVENSMNMGNLFRKELENLNSPYISLVRGKGLLNAAVINEQKDKGAWDLCLKMKELGLLAKPTQKNVIRFAPPLSISQTEIMEGIEIIKKSLSQVFEN